MPPHAPLNLSDLPPDALDDVAAHLPPHALSRLLRCCRKLNEALAAKPQPALEELDMRHLRCRLTDGDVAKAARRYPGVRLLQLDCFALSCEHGLAALAACWRELRDVRLTYVERHTDQFVLPLAGSGCPAPSLGQRLTSLTLSIGSNPLTSPLTDAALASALVACTGPLRSLSIDVGQKYWLEDILAPWLDERQERQPPPSPLESLALAGHWIREAVEKCLRGPEALNLSQLAVLSLHEREWYRAGGHFTTPQGRRLLLLNNMRQWLPASTSLAWLPALTDLSLKMPLSEGLNPADVQLLANAGCSAGVDLSGLRRLTLANSGLKNQSDRISRWTDDMAIMTMVTAQPHLIALELSGFALRVTTAALVEIMAACPHIEELWLPNAPQIDAAQGIPSLVFAEGESELRSGPPFRALSCSGWSGLDASSLHAMLTQPAALTSLTRLHLSGCGPAVDDVSALLLAMNCPAVTSLVLNGSWVTDTGLSHLAGAKCAPELVELSLHGCRAVTGGASLTHLCRAMTSIELLSLSAMVSTVVTDSVIEALALAQSSRAGRLRKLRLDYSRGISAAGCLCHVAAIPSLHELSIQGVSFLQTRDGGLTAAATDDLKQLDVGLEALAGGALNLRRVQIDSNLGRGGPSAETAPSSDDYDSIEEEDEEGNEGGEAETGKRTAGGSQHQLNAAERQASAERQVLSVEALWTRFLAARPEVTVTEGRELILSVEKDRALSRYEL